MILVNSGWRCPSVGSAWACRTRSETLDGPGPVRVFSGTWIGVDREGGGGISRVIVRIGLIWIDPFLLPALNFTAAHAHYTAALPTCCSWPASHNQVKNKINIF